VYLSVLIFRVLEVRRDQKLLNRLLHGVRNQKITKPTFTDVKISKLMSWNLSPV